MREGYKISNYGIDKPLLILCYNWESMNEVGLIKFNDLTLPGINDFCVAIFKIKYKSI